MKDYERTTEAHGSSSLGNGEDRQSVSWLHRRKNCSVCVPARHRCEPLEATPQKERRCSGLLHRGSEDGWCRSNQPLLPCVLASFCSASIPTFISFMTASFLGLTAGWFSPRKGSYLGGSGHAKR